MDQVLAVHLKAAAALTQAQAIAVFVPTRDGRGLELKAQEGILQAGLDEAMFAWRTRLEELRKGQTVRLGQAAVWPLVVDRDLVAVVYLDRVDAAFPAEHQRLHGRVLAERVRHLERPRALGPFLAEVAAPESELRRQLTIALRQCAGNVSAAARALGVHRDTVYDRAARYGIELEAFRPGRMARP